jgi:hypothetical protein
MKVMLAFIETPKGQNVEFGLTVDLLHEEVRFADSKANILGVWTTTIDTPSVAHLSSVWFNFPEVGIPVPLSMHMLNLSADRPGLLAYAIDGEMESFAIVICKEATYKKIVKRMAEASEAVASADGTDIDRLWSYSEDLPKNHPLTYQLDAVKEHFDKHGSEDDE